MIKIKKIDKPKILIENEVAWTKEYCDCLDSGNEPSKEVANRYNEPSIKKALEQETHGKCAYCESKIKHLSYGDIEHILPKNKNARPDLYVNWENMTLSCEQCNRSGKRTYYDPQMLLINPYDDEPSEHLRDIGPLVMPFLGDDRAAITEKVLKLNRTSLIEQRIERIELVKALLNSWAKEKNLTLKKLIEDELHSTYSPDKEYSSTIKGFLKANEFPVKDVS